MNVKESLKDHVMEYPYKGTVYIVENGPAVLQLMEEMIKFEERFGRQGAIEFLSRMHLGNEPPTIDKKYEKP